VLLNLYREHTDWHLTQETHWADKLNLFGHRPDMVSSSTADPRPRKGARRPTRAGSAARGLDAGPGGVTRAGRPYAPGTPSR
jgi:UDP-N-acetylmuramoylalanine-D-glutamate ligase